MLEDCEEIYVLTPSRWDPHDIAYAHNEAQMLDWQGDMVEPKDRQIIELNEVEEDADVSAACYIGYVESQAVIDLLQHQNDDDIDEPCHHNNVPRGTDEIASVLSSVSPLLTDESLYERLNSRKKLSQFQIPIGSTNTSEIKHVVHDDSLINDNVDLDSSSAEEDMLLDKIFRESNAGTFTVDDIMVSAVHAGRHQGVQAKDLTKLWRIDEPTAKKTLDIT